LNSKKEEVFRVFRERRDFPLWQLFACSIDRCIWRLSQVALSSL